MTRIEHHLQHGRSGNIPMRIVVHCMGEYVKDPKPMYAPEFLDAYELSAHSLITPSGDNIRCRNDDEIAWHAKGRNTNSLGIEFLVEGAYNYSEFKERIKTPYVNEIQYQAGLYQIKEWMRLYNIVTISRHSDIDPDRKVDPGEGFDWDRLLADLV